MLTQSSSVVIPLHQPFPQTAAPGLPHNAKVALAYARAGFAVFPCNPVREPHKPSDRLSYGKAKKNPIGVDSWSREATTDEGQIRAWWQQFPDALVGLPMKQNRLLVIDADRHTETDDGVRNFAEICEGREERMPPHPVVSTDFQGEHHFFQMPEKPIGQGKNGLPAAVDVRGYGAEDAGGYVIAGGSRMPDGRGGWHFVKGCPSLLRDRLPLPPQWLIDLCKPPEAKPREQSKANAKAGKAEEAYAIANAQSGCSRACRHAREPTRQHFVVRSWNDGANDCRQLDRLFDC